MMQPAKHSRLPNAVTGGDLVPVVTRQNTLLVLAGAGFLVMAALCLALASISTVLG
jgi:hypothetical protein